MGHVAVCVCVCVRERERERWVYILGIHEDLYRTRGLNVVDPSFQMSLVMFC